MWYQPEDTDISDQSDEEVTGAEAVPAPAETFNPKVVLWTHIHQGWIQKNKQNKKKSRECF